MKLPLSNRLLACCNYIKPGDRVADVGCDHGYLSIYLLKQGIAGSVIASDIHEQPLLSAVRNAEKYGVRDRMTFFLSNGVQNIPRDFDVLVCAGMGGDTMVSILEAGPWLRDHRYRLILQCQSKTPLLRRYLSENGWQIREETVVRDKRFLYTVMEVCWKPDAPELSPGQWYFPPALLENPGPEAGEYFRRVVKKLRIAANGRGETEGSFLKSCLTELEALAESRDLPWLKEEESI